MRRFLANLQLAGVIALPLIGLFVGPGSFFDGILLVAVASWLLWLLGIAAGLRALPGSTAGRLAVLGLVALTAIYSLSILKSPDKPAAAGNLTLVLTYLGWLLAAGSAFSDSARHRIAEPLAWGASLLAATWGLSERLAPGVVHFSTSKLAFGRLLEPIGYWNAMGALAGIGIVLAAGLVSSQERSQLMRAVAAATSPLLMAALWLSFSRGALAATACGLAALCAAAGSRRTARTVGYIGAIGAATAVLCEALPGTKEVLGHLAQRKSDASLLLIGLIGLAIAAAALQWLDQHHFGSIPKKLPKPWLRSAVVGAVLLGLLPGLIVVTNSGDSATPAAATGADVGRLQSLESNRSKYWSVALKQFESSPITGGGSGSFRAAWLRSPDGSSPALNAHSLEIEVLAELGLVGALALLLQITGIWVAGSRRRMVQSGSLAGASAALAVFLAHSSIDWDWQVPGLMFPTLALAAAVAYAPRPGFDRKEPHLTTALCALVGLISVVWLVHIFEAHLLRQDAQRMVNTAKILGWTDRREGYVIERLNEAAWLNPSPLPKADLAAALFDMGRPKEAARLAIQLTRDNPDWWFGWALVWNFRNGTDLATAVNAHGRSLDLRGKLIPRSPHAG